MAENPELETNEYNRLLARMNLIVGQMNDQLMRMPDAATREEVSAIVAQQMGEKYLTVGQFDRVANSLTAQFQAVTLRLETMIDTHENARERDRREVRDLVDGVQKAISRLETETREDRREMRERLESVTRTAGQALAQAEIVRDRSDSLEKWQKRQDADQAGIERRLLTVEKSIAVIETAVTDHDNRLYNAELISKENNQHIASVTKNLPRMDQIEQQVAAHDEFISSTRQTVLFANRVKYRTQQMIGNVRIEARANGKKITDAALHTMIGRLIVGGVTLAASSPILTEIAEAIRQMLIEAGAIP